MMLRLVISLYFLLSFVNAQTIDDVIQYIFDNQDDCGDPFSDPIWVPALDLCNIGCDTLTQICLEDAELNQRCDELPDKCATGLKAEFEKGGIKPLELIPDSIEDSHESHEKESDEHDHDHGSHEEGHSEEEEIHSKEDEKHSEEEGKHSEEEEEKKSKGNSYGGATEESHEYDDDEKSLEEYGDEDDYEGIIEDDYEPVRSIPIVSETGGQTAVEYGGDQQQGFGSSGSPGYGHGSGGQARGGSDAGYSGIEADQTGAGYGGEQSASGDRHSWCCKWAFEGECDRRPRLIRPLCQKSCGTTGCLAESADSCVVSVNVDRSTCWQLQGRTGNPEKDDTHFRPQPAQVVYKQGGSGGSEGQQQQQQQNDYQRRQLFTQRAHLLRRLRALRRQQ